MKPKGELKKVSRVELTKKYGLVFILVIFIIMLSVTTKNFFNVSNFINIFRQISVIGLLSIGMTYVMLSGGIDLTVGSFVGVAGILGAMVARNHSLFVLIPVLAGCAATTALGLINGFSIAWFGIPPFIQTLGMMSIGRGIAYLLTNAHPVNQLSDDFLAVGKGSVGPIPIPVIILVLAFAVFLFILYKAKFGRYIYAIGGNEEAALLSGLKVKSIKVLAYGISGLLSGLGGIILTARLSSGICVSGEGYEMDAIAAVVIGGTSMAGGEGSLWGTALGFLLIGIMNNGLDMLGVSSYIQLLIKGLIIIVSVGLDVQAKKQAR